MENLGPAQVAARHGGAKGRDAPRHPGAEAHADAPKARRPLTGRGQRPARPDKGGTERVMRS